MTTIITTANELVDKNVDNLKVVDAVLSGAANLLRVEEISEQDLAQVRNILVRFNILSVVYDTVIHIVQIIVGTVEILDEIEEWPQYVLEEESNQYVGTHDHSASFHLFYYTGLC